MCDLYPECQNDGNFPLGIPPGQSAGKILENLARRFRPFPLEICGVAQAHSKKFRVVFVSKFFKIWIRIRKQTQIFKTYQTIHV